MIFKKLIIFMVTVFLGIVAGILLIYFITQKMGLPTGISGFIIIVYVVTFLASALVLGRNIPNERDEDSPIDLPATPKPLSGKEYAWLNFYQDSSKAGFPITKKLMIIGRGAASDIMINDLSVSKKHAQIMSVSGKFMIRDLESTNGTFINNHRIEEGFLSPGDMVTFGEAKFQFVCPKSSQILSDGEIEIPIDSEIDISSANTRVMEAKRTASGPRLKDLSKEIKDSNRDTAVPGKKQTEEPHSMKANQKFQKLDDEDDDEDFNLDDFDDDFDLDDDDDDDDDKT